MNFTWRDIVEIVISFLIGSGITFQYSKKYYTTQMNKNKQTQKNGAFSKNNMQIGEINVRK